MLPNRHSFPSQSMSIGLLLSIYSCRYRKTNALYCERKLAARGKGGAAEHDLEHFRTKNPVKSWPAPKEIDFETGGAYEAGYYWLAFNLLNYCTSCKKCNAGFKSNYFPVAGPRLEPPDGPSASAARSEQPFLIYPLGTIDDDPEEVIRFRGLAAFPRLSTH